MDGNVILKYVGIFSDFAGIIGAGVSFIIWYKIRKQTERMIALAGQKNNTDKTFEEMVEYHSKINSTAPYAFCLALTDRTPSLKQNVENFLKKQKMEMPIEELNQSGLTHDNFSDFIKEVKKMRRILQAKGATEIHLFISGPMQAAAMVGAIFDNWIPVKLYNLGLQSRDYEYWCHLSK